jgi:cytochrome c oxidase subunit 2
MPIEKAFHFRPDAAATAAVHVDLLLLFLTIVSVFFTVLILALIVYFALRYRRRSEDEIPPAQKSRVWLELTWTVIPFAIAMVMFGWGSHLYVWMKRPPKDALEINVIGKQWMWKIQHPDGQREINELHLPVDRPVKLTLTSEDVIHDFFVPAFRTKIDVIPGRYVQTWFHPTKIGEYHLFCSQYCGTSHANMVGKVIVMERDAYREWLDSHAEGSLALQGRQLFLKLQCITCHSADAEARAPVLEGLYRRTVPLRDGRTVVADDAYLRESILYPEEKVVQGWEPIMPTFKGQVDEEDLIKLLSFLRSLKPGQTPVRNEEASPPIGAPTVPPGGNPKGRDAVPTSRPKNKSSQP